MPKTLTEKIRKRNELRLKLLRLLREKPKTRNEICEALGYSKSFKLYHKHRVKLGNSPIKKYHKLQNIEVYEKRTTVYDNLNALQKAGLIKQEKVITGKRGRPLILWSIN